MILSREQINRYLRHIAIPEISGAGQKKLIESSAFVISEDVNQAAPLMYYLAALGVGRIVCHFQNSDAHQSLFDNVKDLNPDTCLELAATPVLLDEGIEKVVRIVIGGPTFVVDICSRWLSRNAAEAFIPTVIASANGWTGAVQVFKVQSDFEAFSAKLVENKTAHIESAGTAENTFSFYAADVLAVIELVKCCLDLGNPLTQGLLFDLLQMQFHDRDMINALSDDYFTGNITPFDPGMLTNASVLIVGSGGLGSPAAYALAAAGIGTIGLVDYDQVEISNLNRQIMHATSRIGMPKVKSAEVFLRKINPDLNLKLYETSFSKDNAFELIKDYDIVIDGLDNLPTRYLLNDVCHFTGKPLVSAGVLGFTGLATTLVPGSGHCYRCVFPEEKSTGHVPSCTETGVLGPVPGLMGFIEAAEAFKYLTGIGTLLKNRLLFFDALDTDIYTPDHLQDPNCALCGSAPTINALGDYKFVCENKSLS